MGILKKNNAAALMAKAESGVIMGQTQTYGGNSVLSDIYKSTKDMVTPAPPYFAQELKVQLSTFCQVLFPVFDAIDTNTLYGAIKLIHRYDEPNNEWFLTLECGTIHKNGTFDPQAYAHKHTYTALSNRFDIKSGITSSSFTDDYDQDYFDHIHMDYGPDGGPVDYRLIDINTNVKSMVFPWECEIKQLLLDNGFNDTDAINAPDNIEIVFTPYTSEHNHNPSNRIGTLLPDSAVKWPHMVAIYLNDNTSTVDYLDDAPTFSGLVFKGKAANYSTLCPPRCPLNDNYYWPLHLSHC